MDRKSILILVACFCLLMLWYPLVNKLYPPKPRPPGATNAPLAALTLTNQTATSPAAPPALQPPAAPAPAPLVTAGAPEELLVLTHRNVRYTFTSHGGGLKEVDITYPEPTSPQREKPPPTNHLATLNAFTPAPTLALLGGEAVQGDGIFALARTHYGARAEKTLTNGLSIVKEFHLSTNYLVAATVRLENRSPEPLALPAQEWVIGTATPLTRDDRSMVLGVMWYNGAKTDDKGGPSYFASKNFACMPRIPPAEYRAGANNVVWAAVHNQFFALAAMPQQPAAQIVVRKVDIPRPATVNLWQASTNATPPAEGYAGTLVYPPLTLIPGQTHTNQVFLFAGPKEYQTLAKIADRFGNNIDLVMGYGGFFGFFAKGLLLAMNWLHNVLSLSYGWAIIVITVIIKLLFWPLTQASTRSMKRLQALQPQMAAIREKYKDDPAKMNKKTMEFMKENKVSPLGGCLPMLLQIPVFFGFFKMIQSAIELRGARFLWIQDLSQPDTLFDIPGTGFPFNLLPLIMGATMLWQARLTPPSPGMDPMQAKLMRYMPLMFLVFLYNFSAGLTLYWTVQNLLTIAQTMLTRTAPAPAPAPGKAPALTPPPKKRK